MERKDTADKTMARTWSSLVETCSSIGANVTGYLKKLISWLRDWGPLGICYALLLGVLVGYTVIQVHSFAAAYTEPDPDGYIWMAKHFARCELPLTEQPDQFLFHDHIWVENREGLVTAKFAPGYPILLAGAYTIGGDTAMFWVSPLLGGLALVGAFLLFRLWMPTFPSVLAVLTLATTRMYLFYSGYLLTHIPNLCFVTWGAYCLWKWYREPGVGWAVAAGLLIGFAATIRHTTVLMALVVAVALLSRLIQDWREGSYHPRATLSLVSAGLVFPVLLLLYNGVVFGGILTTGYHLSGEQSAFSWSHFADNYQMLARGMYNEVLPVVLPVALIGLVGVGNWTERVMRVLWCLPVYLCYSGYYWAQAGIVYYRFMIVTLPVLVGTAYAVTGKLSRRSGKWLGALVLCGLTLLMNYRGVQRVYEGKWGHHGRVRLARIGRTLTAELEDDAVIFVPDSLKYHLGVRAHFRLYELRAFRPGYAQDRIKRNRGLRPRRQPSRTKRFRRFYEDASRKELRQKLVNIASSYMREGRQVAFLVSPRHAKHLERRLGDDFRLDRESVLESARRKRAIYVLRRAEKTPEGNDGMGDSD